MKETPTPRFKYAVNTNTFKNKLSTAEIVALCVKSGADGIEWGLKSLDTARADAQEMHKLTTDAGLEVMGFLNAGQMWKEDLMRRWSEAIAGCGGRTLRVAHPWFAWDYAESLHQPDPYLELVRRSREAIRMLESLSREYHLKYVLETHSGSIAADPWAIRYLMENVDPDCVGAIYDPANTAVEGFIRLRGACELLGRHLAYVHAKNLIFVPRPAFTEPGHPQRLQWKTQRAFLDQGMIDYVELFFALKCSGYSGWLSMEDFVTDNPVREISEGIAFLKHCAEVAPAEPCEPFTSFNK
jgi:sugar phosphate isomerase/epimerase